MTRPLLVALFVAFVVIGDAGSFLEDFENKTIDARLRFFAAPTPKTGRILILDISEDSIRKLEPVYGRWPWPRSVFGEVAAYLSRNGAAAVGFDLLFSEKSLRQEVSGEMLEHLKSLANNTDIPEIRGQLIDELSRLAPDLHDDEFAAQIAGSKNIFQSSVFFSLKPATGSDEPPSSLKGGLPPSETLRRMRINAPPDSPLRHYNDVTLPYERLAASSNGIGFINVSPDRDGVCRAFRPLATFGKRSDAYPSLSLIIAAHVLKVPLSQVIVSGNRIRIGNRTLYLKSDGTSYIHYQGGRIIHSGMKRQSFESFYNYMPLDLVLESIDLLKSGGKPPVSPEYFKDRIVLVTATAAGLSDLRSTPFSPVTPGVEIHANIIDGILSGHSFSSPGTLITAAMICIPAVLLSILVFALTPIRGFMVFLVFSSGIPAISWFAIREDQILPLIKPFTAMMLTYLCVLLLKYLIEHREKARIRSAFSHYLAPSVLNSVLQNPDQLKLGGERRQATILFADLQGFTSFAERLPPEEVGSTLNILMEELTSSIQIHDGTIDKFIGDAIMAEWNVPADQPGHASLACAAALEMESKIEKLAVERNMKSLPRLGIRIGINTGEVVSGNMGSKDIFDYTVIGNEVNTASRLEAFNKEFGTVIAVSSTTAEETERHQPGKFRFRLLASTLLVGRKVPLDVYELAGYMSSPNDDQEDLFYEVYGRAIRKYLDGDLGEASKLFVKALELKPDDSASKVYEELCRKIGSEQLEGDWDGTYRQMTK